MIRKICEVVIILFLIAPCGLLSNNNSSWATPMSIAKTLKIPSEYGRIKESYVSEGAGLDAGPTIIHIQDAHCNYEAQKNMASLLEYLVHAQGLKLIMVEGGSGNVNLSFLRGYSDKRAREEIADRYLKSGKISGEEYFDIVSDYPLELYGVEDQALYDAHLEVFKKVDSVRGAGLEDVEKLSRITETLKSYIYNEQLMQLDEKSKNYEDRAITLMDYCQYLKGVADKKNLSLKEYPHLVAFVETLRLEKEIDFKQAEAQRGIFIKELAGLLDEKGMQGLIQKTEDFKAKNLTAEEYYSFLISIAQGKISLSDNYPYLNAYIQYITATNEISATGLLKEVSAIAGRVEEACFVNAEEKRLSEIVKSLALLGRILNLELTPEDYTRFKANRPKFLTSSWIDFLTQNCDKYNLALSPSTSGVIDDNLKQLEEFYQLGAYREEAFVENMLSKIKDSKEKIVALITGGFHTPGITQMLKDKGYSYIVISPAITKKGDPNLYFLALRGEKSHPEESFDISDVQGEQDY